MAFVTHIETVGEDMLARDRALVRAALERIHGLTLFQGVLAAAPARAVLSLLSLLAAPQGDAAGVARAYSRAFATLADASNDVAADLPDAWQAYLVDALLGEVNPLSRAAERAGSAAPPPGLRTQAERDLRALRLLFDLDADTLWRLTVATVTPALPALADAWTPWRDLAPPRPTRRTLSEPAPRDVFTRQVAETADWARLVDPLAAYWARHGVGPLARYHVLRWEGREGELRGIAHPDEVRLDALVAYEREQALLTANLERFLAGLPAHDALLYGAPGTGKSSTVKALATTYADRGLCLVEAPKEDLGDLPAILAQLRDRARRYVLFVDDLSFEDDETEYKALKVLLEGTAERRPANVLVHATTNRLNLIRERFSDRGAPADDVQWRDTMDEKASLAQRFGLRVTFALPDQERYLTIAMALARHRGLTLPEDDLRARALSWQRQHTGRSGRLARQFVDDLQGELGSADPRKHDQGV